MEKLSKLILTPESMAVIPYYDEYGKLCSKILETNKEYHVEQSPKNVINHTLQYFADDLKGAIKGSKALLGPLHMPPIVICAELNMYWFPIHSPNKHECIWLSLMHIDRIIETGLNECEVLFKNNQKIKIKMKATRLRKKQSLASMLKVMMDDRVRLNRHYKYYSDDGLMYVSEMNPYVYRIKRNEY